MRFTVKALDGTQGISVATVDATDAADARRQLTERGMRVISVARDLQLNISRRQRFPIVIFSQELVALLGAGLSLVEAIDALTEKEMNSVMRQSLEQIRARLFEGRTLSSALEELPSTFPPLYVATIRASERTGGIEEALTRFIAYQEQLDVLKKKVVNASIYPIVLCAAGLLVTLFLLVYVVPSFAGMYEDLGSNVPAASRLLMSWGQLISANGGTALAAAVIAVGSIVYAVTRSGVRAASLRGIAKIPSIGVRLHTYQLARLYRTVGMLLRGGTPAVSALRMSAGTLSEALRPNLHDAVRSVSEGRPLASSLEEVSLTTSVSARMLRVGQKSGNMGDMMERIATFYDSETERSVDLLTRLIEPLLMIVIGLIIGLVVVLMYFPIFELAGSIQ